MAFLARLMSKVLPAALFYTLVKMITRFPEHAAKTTTSFIKSPLGIQQAL